MAKLKAIIGEDQDEVHAELKFLSNGDDILTIATRYSRWFIQFVLSFQRQQLEDG
ncbi:MAG: hypothetical protein JRJ77_01460 [Deltaproteobacteria bacterium]|nr:hypothetical protein [Deltaproteobacteria bacterium]MBW2339182.1 hypothetical protein [Deltaproteobacteria bacterium]